MQVTDLSLKKDTRSDVPQRLTGIGDQPRLRLATRKDAPFILLLEEDGMRSYAEALWGKWVPSSNPEALLLEGHEMIEWGGGLVGCVACEWQADHLRIKKLYVSPQYRRRGIGACVLVIKLRQAERRGLTLRLTVLSTNNDARRFYEREGMSVVDRTEERITLQFYKRDPKKPPTGNFHKPWNWLLDFLFNRRLQKTHGNGRGRHHDCRRPQHQGQAASLIGQP